MGYPEYFKQTEQATFGVFTPETDTELYRGSASDGPGPVYSRWMIQSQQVEGHEATVRVAVLREDEWVNNVKRPLLEPSWEIVEFHLVKQDGKWLVSSPLPAAGHIGPSACLGIYPDTPGLATPPWGAASPARPFLLQEGDRWQFDVVLEGYGDHPLEGVGFMVVESVMPRGPETTITRVRKLSWAKPGASPEDQERYFDREENILITQRPDSLIIKLGRYNTVRYGLPLKEEERNYPEEDGKTVVAVRDLAKSGKGTGYEFHAGNYGGGELFVSLKSSGDGGFEGWHVFDGGNCDWNVVATSRK
jgi:hypothetical protein